MNERKNELILKSELYYYDLSYLLETLGAKSGLELRTPNDKLMISIQIMPPSKENQQSVG